MDNPAGSRIAHRRVGETEPVGLTWLVTVRWTTLLAGAGAMAAGHSALQVSAPIGPAAGLLAACALSNLWLLWRTRSGTDPGLPRVAGILLCADVLLISWLLWRSGGVLNPVSVFYLVPIVVSALVLGRAWTWGVTALSAGAYAALFLAPPAELRAAQVMHPEIALHMRGMWLGFAGTALIIAVLVARLADAVERRDRALEALRERTARATRVAGLATLAAGAAHELSTPLSTIAVAARELERNLIAGNARADWQHDANLIRVEAGRCRQILDGMAAAGGGTIAEVPRVTSVGDIVSAATAHVSAADRGRIAAELGRDIRVVWPATVVARALGNLLQNAVQASPGNLGVELRAAEVDGVVHVSVVDHGAGMSPEDLGRAGEPFFTTKPAGEGTGLGLFVARSSAEQLGGRLELSSAIGRGTTATLILPRDVVGE
jgi:two-component system sensor histidine kinase RegB